MFKFVIKVMSWTVLERKMHPRQEIYRFGMNDKNCFYHCLRRCCVAVFERQIVYNYKIDKNIATGLLKYQEYRFGIS